MRAPPELPLTTATPTTVAVAVVELPPLMVTSKKVAAKPTSPCRRPSKTSCGCSFVSTRASRTSKRTRKCLADVLCPLGWIYHSVTNKIITHESEVPFPLPQCISHFKTQDGHVHVALLYCHFEAKQGRADLLFCCLAVYLHLPCRGPLISTP